MRLIRSSLRDLNFFAMQPGVETPGYFHSPLWGWGMAQNYALLKPVRVDFGSTRASRVPADAPSVGPGVWQTGNFNSFCAPQMFDAGRVELRPGRARSRN